MGMRYAQLGEGGICIGVSTLAGQVLAPGLIEIANGVDPTGKRWNGAAFEDVPAVALTAKQQAQLELDQIDRDTGIPRSLREVLVAIGTKTGADVAYLAGKEAAAVIARGKLR